MPEQLTMFPPLAECEDLADLERQVKLMQEHAKAKRNWEDAFQRWSNKQFEDGTTPYGACGHGVICDWCEENDKGRPCVRALNTMLREKRKTINYDVRNFDDVFMGRV